MRRFFIDKNISVGDTLELTGDEARHLVTVLRMAAGSELILINGSGAEHTAKLIKVGSDFAELTVTGEALCAAEPVNKVALYQCLPKAGKLDLIVQKCVELGISSIHPVYSKRCIVKPERRENKLIRYNKIAQEAAKQCGRAVVPRVHPVEELKSVAFGEYDLVLIAYEDEHEHGIKAALKAFARERGGQASSIAIVIGPEGGFEAEEVDAVLKNGNARAVTLGCRILRTETAGMAMLAMLMYEMEG